MLYLLIANLRQTQCNAEEVHNQIEQNFSKVKHIMVHVNPADVSEMKTEQEQGVKNK